MAAHTSKHLHSKKSDKNPICILHNLFCHAIIEKAILFYFVFIERNVLCQFENRYAVSAFFSRQSAPCRFAPVVPYHFWNRKKATAPAICLPPALLPIPKVWTPSLPPMPLRKPLSKTFTRGAGRKRLPAAGGSGKLHRFSGRTDVHFHAEKRPLLVL